MRCVLIALVLCIGSTQFAAGQTFPAGSATLVGFEKVTAKRCDTISGGGIDFPISMDGMGGYFQADGTITAPLVRRGNSGRSFGVALDAASHAILADQTVGAVEHVCGGYWTISVFDSSYSLKLNKRHTSAVLRRSWKFVAHDLFQPGERNGRGWARYRGAWVPAP